MSIVNAKKMSPSDAIKAAMGYFNEFFAGQKIENKLLEELDFNDSTETWVVTVGFDVGRTKMKQPGMNALAGFVSQEIVPVREARRFFIRDSDAGLIKMDDA